MSGVDGTPGCSRRCLLAGAGATAGLAGAVLGGAPVQAAGKAAGKAVIATSKVPVGGGVVVGARGVVVTQPRKGSFRVFSARCTHAGCQVGQVVDRRIECPCHGSAFAIATGAPVAGPASTPLAKVAFTITKGRVYLR